ncbi:MAG TPA: hypothetical protein PLV06_08110 [Bacteroidales bacterium]|nr:hypothetical protein [Bacteroidales bacterium]HPF01927.1 hypothetical protein [Bacteroidales bacterium]HPJ59943.1 hypothetical protein [Bacteroidales bacterium]HPR12332.1 hypothetical protein [Bacteroidales bacterium]HRW83817.1 hypothetical protein [Bacteroidales bacterium]
MKAKSVLFYILGAISLVVAIVLFFKWLNLKLLLPLMLAVAGIVFFWIGSSAGKSMK